MDALHARELFREAAILYFKSFFLRDDEQILATMQPPAWMFKAITLALSASDTGLTREGMRDWRDETQGLVPDLILARMLAASFLAVEQRNDEFTKMYFELAAVAESMPAHPVGRFGWPLGAYSQSIGPLVESRDHIDIAAFSRLLSPFADQLYDSIRSAQRSSYHWRRLYSRLLPIEPEAVAVCETACVFLDKQELPEEEKRRAFAEFPPSARAYFEVAAELRRHVNRERRIDRREEDTTPYYS